MRKYRLFISVPLEKTSVRQLGYSVRRAEEALPIDSFRILSQDLWHITLLFLGDQDEEDLALITSGLEDFVSEFDSIEGSLVSMDYDKNKKMIWGYGDDGLSEKLGEMSGRLQDILIERGLQFKPENRRFKAHVTLARADKSGYGQNLPEIKEDFDLGVWADKIELVSSTLTSRGPEHDKLGEFWFGR